MTMSGIQYQHIHMGIYQGSGTIQYITRYTDGSGTQQTTILITGGIGILNSLFNILDGDESTQIAVRIHDGKLFNLMSGQDLLGFFQSSTDGSSYQILLGHHFLDLHIVIRQEAQVTVGDDAHQLALFTDRHAADAILAHQFIGIKDKMLRREMERIYNNTVLTSLDPIHFFHLLFDAHILMNNTDTAFPGNGNRHIRCGNSIHGSCHDGGVELDILGQPGRYIHLIGKYLRCSRNQQNIVKGQTFLAEFLSEVGIEHILVSPPVSQFFPVCG